MQNSNPRIKETANMIRRMLRPGGGDTKPKGPDGLPSTTPNQDNTVQHHYDGEGLVDPGVVNGVTGTGGGAIIN